MGDSETRLGELANRRSLADGSENKQTEENSVSEPAETLEQTPTIRQKSDLVGTPAGSKNSQGTNVANNYERAPRSPLARSREAMPGN